MFRIFAVMFALALAGCGVKGKPLPPLEPAPIGDGTLSRRQKENQKKIIPLTAPREAPPTKAPGR